MSAAAEAMGSCVGAWSSGAACILVDAKRATSGGVVSNGIIWRAGVAHVALPQLCVAAVRRLAQIGGHVDEGAREDEDEVWNSI